MSESTIYIPTLLQEIRALLQDYTSKGSDHSTLKRQRVVFLLQKIQRLQQYQKSTLPKIIQNSTLSNKLRDFLYLRLRQAIGTERLQLKYKKEACKAKETYFFMQSKQSTLMKEIIDNIKTIEIQMTKLTQNLETVYQQLTSTNDQATGASCDFELGILLRIVMETTQLQLQNPIDEMLFRLFILEESISLILHKTEYTLKQMSGKLPTCQVASNKSEHSNNTKRSALSESLLIFKMNNPKEEKPLELRSQPTHFNQNQIRTDYVMHAKPEKKIHKAEKRANCCFGF